MSAIQKGKYRHYKGHLYEVTGTAHHSETLEDIAVTSSGSASSQALPFSP